MSLRYREKYPQKIVGTFSEPMCQIEDNYRCVIPKPHQGWFSLAIKSQGKNDYHTGNLTDCIFVHHPFSGSEAAIAGRVYHGSWLVGWASCAH